MRRGTTPTIRVTVADADITGMRIYLTLESGRTEITRENDSLEISLEDGDTVILCRLTQAETLAFKPGQRCEVQIRAIDNGGAVALASTIGSIPVDRILLDGELDG